MSGRLLFYLGHEEVTLYPGYGDVTNEEYRNISYQ